MMKPSRLIALSVVLVAVGAAANTTLAEDVLILQGSEVCKDVYINAAHPQTNSGTSIKLSVFRSNVPHYSLIKFDLSKLPRDRVAKDVALMIFMEGENYAGTCNPMVLEAYALAADWREDEMTWLNRTGEQKWKQSGGDYDGKKLRATFDIPSRFGRGWIVLKGPSLTRLVNVWIKRQEPNYGLILKPKGEAGGASSKKFISSENRDAQYRANKPKLIISSDEFINPADHGYISDAELVKRPLREKLKAIADSVEPLSPELKAKIESLAAEIERITAAGDAQHKALEKKLAELRLDPIRELWPGKKIIVWPISSWEKLSQDQIPRPGSAAISTRMLQNEYQELSLALTNISNRDQTLSVSLSGLDDYPAGKLTLRASYWILAKSRGRMRGEAFPIQVDDALPRLEDDKLLRLKAGQTRRLFLTVNSNGVKDGTYRLGLKIASKTNKTIAEVPVQVQVLPLSLLKDKDLSVHTYAYLQRRSTTKYKAFTVKDLKAHYQNTYVFNLVAQPKVDEAGNIVEKADYSKIREQLRLMQDAKMIIHFWHEANSPRFLRELPWLSDPWKKAFRTWLLNYVKVLREEGFDYDRFMPYPFDESYDNPVHGGRPEYQALEEIAQEIHKIDPRIQVFCNPAAFGPDDREWFMKLQDDIAIWSLHFLIFSPRDNTGWPKKFSKADKKAALSGFFAEEQRAGKPVWAFQIKGRAKTAEDVNAHFRRWAWQVWDAGLTGMGLWSYNDVRGKSGWTDEDGGDYAVIYELRDAPADIPRQPFEPFMPSRRWQAWRAGVQDYFLLQQVRKIRPDLYPELKKLAKDILQDSSNHATYEQAREKLIDYLLESN